MTRNLQVIDLGTAISSMSTVFIAMFRTRWVIDLNLHIAYMPRILSPQRQSYKVGAVSQEFGRGTSKENTMAINRKRRWLDERFKIFNGTLLKYWKMDSYTTQTCLLFVVYLVVVEYLNTAQCVVVVGYLSFRRLFSCRRISRHHRIPAVVGSQGIIRFLAFLPSDLLLSPELHPAHAFSFCFRYLQRTYHYYLAIVPRHHQDSREPKICLLILSWAMYLFR